MCYDFFFFLGTTKLLSFKLITQNFHSLKEIVIIKPHKELITVDIAQIIDKYNRHGYYSNN